MPSPTRIVTAKPPRPRKPAAYSGEITGPQVVKTRPALVIKRENKWRKLIEAGLAGPK
jgi:hypothetical protein